MIKGRNFLKLLDYTPEELNYLLELSEKLKVPKSWVYGKTRETGPGSIPGSPRASSPAWSAST